MHDSNTFLLSEYDRQLPVFRELSTVVENILDNAIKENHFTPMQVAGRLKTRESLSEKIFRKAGKYRDLNDITDIVGFRVIFYYSDQVDTFSKVIEDLFPFDEELSTDKRRLMPATSFGYLSLHYICTLPKGKGYPDYLCGLPFEIQLRSVLQHTWAEIEHDLGYKTDYSLPRDILREFARIASLLEIADERFVALRKRTANYTELTRENMSTDHADEMTLDRVTLTEFVSRSSIMTTLVADIAEICNASIRYVSPESYLPILADLGIRTIGELKQACIQARPAIMERARMLLEGSDIEELVSNVGLYYLCKVMRPRPE